MGQMYPDELKIKDTTESTTSASRFTSVDWEGWCISHFHLRRTRWFQFPHQQLSVRSNIPNTLAYGVLNLYHTPGLAPRMNILFWGPGDFPVSCSNRATFWNAWNRHSGSLRSIRGSYSAIWSMPLTNVKWHSDPWPTMPSHPIRPSIIFTTSIPSLTFTELWVVSMEHLQRVWLASSKRLPFRTSDSAPPPFLELACAPIVETRFLELAISLLDLNNPLYFSILLMH